VGQFLPRRSVDRVCHHADGGLRVIANEIDTVSAQNAAVLFAKAVAVARGSPLPLHRDAERVALKHALNVARLAPATVEGMTLRHCAKTGAERSDGGSGFQRNTSVSR